MDKIQASVGALTHNSKSGCRCSASWPTIFRISAPYKRVMLEAAGITTAPRD
jgi:hypothetical protein